MNYFLLAALIAVGIYIYWDDKKSWELVYETTGHAMHHAQARFSYLKAQGVKCRLKTSSTRGITFRGMSNPNISASVKLEVHKKDLETAWTLLSEFT